VVVGGVQRVANEPGCEPYDDLSTILATAILKRSADESQSACSLPYNPLLTGLGPKIDAVIVAALPGSDRSICKLTGQAYLDLGLLRCESAADLCKQCLILAPR
jgi:hypothetical protein